MHISKSGTENHGWMIGASQRTRARKETSREWREMHKTSYGPTEPREANAIVMKQTKESKRRVN